MFTLRPAFAASDVPTGRWLRYLDRLNGDRSLTHSCLFCTVIPAIEAVDLLALEGFGLAQPNSASPARVLHAPWLDKLRSADDSPLI